MHSAGGAQPLRDGNVALGPGTPCVSWRESSPERGGVTMSELPIDPAKADRLVECLVVRERCRIRRAFLGEDEPHTLGVGVVVVQPGPPPGRISDQQLWKCSAGAGRTVRLLHSDTVSLPDCATVGSPVAT